VADFMQNYKDFILPNFVEMNKSEIKLIESPRDAMQKPPQTPPKEGVHKTLKLIVNFVL